MALSSASQEAICDLVDTGCPVNLSEQPQLVVSAYLCVFVPWGFLTLSDMITSRWKTIRAVFLQGLMQLAIAVPTMSYTIYYIEVQRAGRDYKEMCAAIVAVILSGFHFIRTLWGLLQLYYLWKWVRRSLRHLNAHGYLHNVERPRAENWYWRFAKEFMRQVVFSLRSKLSGGLESESHANESPMSSRRKSEKSIPSLQCSSQCQRKHRNSSKEYRTVISERKLKKLAASMLINCSLIDNEFFESDMPFAPNYYKLFVPKEWFSQKQTWIVPSRFSDACLRYMVYFLAQFGTGWLKDSQKVYDILQRKGVCKRILTSNYLDHAQMLTLSYISEHSEYEEEWISANWSKAWSGILWRRESANVVPLEHENNIPFRKRHKRNVYLGFRSGPFESRIKRLVDELSPELLDLSSEEFDTILRVCGFDVENFVMFLQSQPLESLTNVGKRNASGEIYIPKPVYRYGSVSIPLHQGDVPVTRHAYGQLVFGKFGVDAVTKYQDAFKRIWIWSEKRILELTVHMENLFAMECGYRNGYALEEEESSYRIKYKENLRELPSAPQKTSSANPERPCCLSQLWYWNHWGLPENSPPVLGDATRHVFSTKQGSTSLHFIGYVMEIVRNCLAEWTHEDTEDITGASNTWSIDVPSTSLVFDASPELSKMYQWSRKESNACDKSEVSCFIVPDCTEDEGNSFKLTLVERIIWECQQHILRLVNIDERARCYGPNDVELMLLFLLGFPLLETSVVEKSKKGKFTILVRPVSWVSSLFVAIEFEGEVSRDGSRIGMSIASEPVSEDEELEDFCSVKRNAKFTDNNSFIYRSHGETGTEVSLKFHWSEWIHSFEGCMNVLSGKIDKDDVKLQQLRRIRNDQNRNLVKTAHRDESIFSEGDKRSLEMNNTSDSSDVHEKREMGTRGDERAKEDQDRDASICTEVFVDIRNCNDCSTRDGPRSHGHELSICDGCTGNKDSVNSVEYETVGGVQCKCRYDLRQKAEQCLVRGTTKYHWDWKGWEPQAAFRTLPILYERQKAKSASRGPHWESSNTAFSHKKYHIADGNKPSMCGGAQFKTLKADENV